MSQFHGLQEFVDDAEEKENEIKEALYALERKEFESRAMDFIRRFYLNPSKGEIDRPSPARRTLIPHFTEVRGILKSP